MHKKQWATGNLKYNSSQEIGWEVGRERLDGSIGESFSKVRLLASPQCEQSSRQYLTEWIGVSYGLSKIRKGNKGELTSSEGRFIPTMLRA